MDTKEQIYSGKTKNIYKQSNGNLLIIFKDDVTGHDGVVDPGANSIMGQIKGKGRMSLAITQHFFELFHNEKIPTHLLSVDLEQNSMEAKEAELPGKNICAPGGLEFICRRKAYGSFIRRYQKYVKEELQDLSYLVEITLKDDKRGDPLINDDTILALGLLNRMQLESAKNWTQQITQIIEKDVSKKNLCLIDLKIEFGLIDNVITLIDEVSADSMRLMDKNGNILSHEDVYQCLFKS